MCSVLFCDVVGFTPLSESRDPEAVRELLSRYFGVAGTVIGRYGGVVEKFIGDAVMAVWGTPTATEEDAERAGRAALDLVAAVSQLGGEVGVPDLAARAGVVTGELAVTLGAVGEGMVAGDAVNTAARVQAAAEPGQVLVDEATYRLAGGAIGFADAGSHRLKGKTEPQRLWRATWVLSGVGGSQRVDGLEAPLIGRDAELRTIKELFHAAAERRAPRLVLVSGPAGVGKSRLGWEFWKYSDGLTEEVWWHRGRCLSYGAGVAFWALAEIVRQRLGIAEEDPAETAAGKLSDGLDRFVPDPGERAYVGARLGRLLGVAITGDSGASLSQEELFAGWRLFFERLAAEGPVVLLVEDAQYADAGLLDFLDHLIDWSRDLPVYVLVFARPELGQARPGFGAGRNRSTLTLDPLDPASMDQLVDALVPGMPPAARSRITSQAQGIPLFAVETVRALIDRDIVQPVEGVYRLVGDVGELAVPDSLHALLAARLDALDPGVRRLVTDAAVLGTTFPAEALIAVSGRDEPDVRAALAELVRREVFSVSADRLSPERGSYQFAQQMLRQVAYDTLSRRDRKTRHLKVAAHLRATFAGDGEEVADVIAQHYLDALNAIPDAPDIAEIRGQAIGALIRAAERAERTGAPARAATSYAIAAELTPPDTLRTGSSTPRTAHQTPACCGNAPREPPSSARDYAAAGSSMPAVPVIITCSAARTGRLPALRLSPGGRCASGAAWPRHASSSPPRSGFCEQNRTPTRCARWTSWRHWRYSRDRRTPTGSPPRRLSSARPSTSAPASSAACSKPARSILFSLSGGPKRSPTFARPRSSLPRPATTSCWEWRCSTCERRCVTDPASAAEAARTAAGHFRRVGNPDFLADAIGNLADNLMQLGDWDAAEEELTQAIASGELAEHERIASQRAELAALRGDAATAETMLEGLRDMARQ